MSDENDSNELLREGLTSYTEARGALLAFESLITRPAKDVLTKFLSRLGEVTAQPSLAGNTIFCSDWKPDDPRDPSFCLGAGIPAPPTWGFYCGVGWQAGINNADPLVPLAKAVFKCGAQKRKNNMLKKLEGTLLNGLMLWHTAYPYEVGLARPVGEKATVEEISKILSDATSAMLDVFQAKGGLNAILAENDAVTR